jgi:integrase/recombinase XerD
MNFKQYLQEKNFTEKTIYGYEKVLKQFFKWLEDERINIKEMRYADMLAYVKQVTRRGVGKRYLAQQLTGIRHYFNYLIKTKQVKDNIAAHLFIKGHTNRLPHNLLSEEELEKIYHSYKLTNIIGKRNKIILGLIIYQGLASPEIGVLEVGHINLLEGTIYVPALKRSNSRTLKLREHQITELTHYIKTTRRLIIELTEKKSDKLFLSVGVGERASNIIDKLMKHLRKKTPGITTVQQLRNSVVAIWVKKYNLREAQYMAGHRYISSTERYLHTNLDDLKKDIDEFHPLNK